MDPNGLDPANFAIALSSIGNFNSPIALSISGLPAGLTGVFSPDVVTPSGTSILTLTAVDDSLSGLFNFDIVAEGGGITHMTASSVSLSFGLIPTCKGTFEGTVYDADTGLPIPFSFVRLFKFGPTTPVDVNGHYILTDVPLGFNNAPQPWNPAAIASGYWDASGSGIAECGKVTEVDIFAIKIKFGAVKGRVVVGEPDLLDIDPNLTVFPTDIPLEDVGIRIIGRVTVTDAGGFYQLDQFSLRTNNVSQNGSVSTEKDGHWRGTSPSVVIEADTTTPVLLITMVPICTSDLRVRLTYGDTKEPAAFTRVDIKHPNSGTFCPFTDANGEILLENLRLGFNNFPAELRLVVSTSAAPGYNALEGFIIFGQCGAVISAEFELEPRVENFGALEGHVVDENGDPVEGISVSFFASGFGSVFAETDASGYYLAEDVRLGFDLQTNLLVTAALDGFTSQTKQATAKANETTILNFEFGGEIKLFELRRIDDPLEVLEATTLSVEIAATSTDPVILEILNLPPFASFTDNGDGTGTLTLTPGFDDSGDYLNVQITATDGTFFDSQFFTIKVINLNRLPVAKANDPYVVDEGKSITLDATGASDADGGPLFYGWDLNEDGFFTAAVEKQRFLFLEDGVFNIVLRVGDGSDFAFDTTTLTVNELPPRAGFSVPSLKSEGTFVDFNDVTFAYPDEIISWEWLEALEIEVR